jgi:hypothetical protein
MKKAFPRNPEEKLFLCLLPNVQKSGPVQIAQIKLVNV